MDDSGINISFHDHNDSLDTSHLSPDMGMTKIPLEDDEEEHLKEPTFFVTPISDSYDPTSVYADDKVLISSNENWDGFIEYEREIYLHRVSLEHHYYPIGFMATQPEITPGMRALLIDWMTKVSHHYKTLPETLFLAVNVADRFMACTHLSYDCLQLLGVVAFFIASKQEETCPLSIGQIFSVCDEKYTYKQVFQLERLILCRLQFDLLAPTPLYFMEALASRTAGRFRRIDSMVDPMLNKCIRQRRCLGKFLLELSLQDYSFTKYTPSLLAGCILTATDHAFDDGYVLFQPGPEIRKIGTDFRCCLDDVKHMTSVAVESKSDAMEIVAAYEKDFDK